MFDNDKGPAGDSSARPREADRPRLCWFPFCENDAVGSAVLICYGRRASVQACRNHAGRTYSAHFTTPGDRGTR